MPRKVDGREDGLFFWLTVDYRLYILRWTFTCTSTQMECQKSSSEGRNAAELDLSGMQASCRAVDDWVSGTVKAGGHEEWGSRKKHIHALVMG